MNGAIAGSAGVWWRTALVIVALVALNLVLTDQRIRPLYAEFDKLVHASVFFVITLMFGWSTGLGPIRVAGLAMALGALDELLQLGLPGRSTDWGDWAADCTGAILAAVVLWWLRRPAPCDSRAN